MRKNAYPDRLIDTVINQFLTRVFVVKDVTPTVKDSKTFQLYLPYLGPSISRTERSINKLFEQYLPKCRVKVITKATVRLSSLFSFKNLSSGVIYKFTCGTCNGIYIGKTKRHLKTRYFEHFVISALMGKPVGTI